MSFILRVDDVGWRPEDKSPDKGLAYFQSWREALNIRNAPVYYGVIPQMVGDAETSWLNANLGGNEELAVHGWDHAVDAHVGPHQMRDSISRLNGQIRCRSYIPPFNKYDDYTITDWGKVCPNGYFFGGFPEPTSMCRVLPSTYKMGYFLPAVRELYDHSEPLLEHIPHWTHSNCPLVVTLHATWGYRRLDLIHQLGEILEPHLVSADVVRKWSIMKGDRLNRRFLSAPHYLAYKWVLERLGNTTLRSGMPLRVLDFGSRYSYLPSLMAMHGCRVKAIDRDDHVRADQSRISFEMGVDINIQHINDVRDIDRLTYDVITCCWSVQHNPLEDIPNIVSALSSKLSPHGKMLIVGSFSPKATYEQADRLDPQFVLSQEDYVCKIFSPSGLRISQQEYFWYEHGTPMGEFCSRTDPKVTATCCELLKG